MFGFIKEQVKFAKKDGLIYATFYILSCLFAFIPYVGFVLKILSFLFLFLALKTVAELSNSSKIQRDFFIFVFSYLAYTLISFFKDDMDVLVLYFSYLLYSSYLLFSFNVFKALAMSSDVALFVYAFAFVFLAAVLEFFNLSYVLSYVLYIIGSILGLLAWLNLRYIYKK
ncbi:MAG TPA: hypothetical protein K8V51_02660 [Campylobacter avium]|uniref:hypothetical protein n=1 Tax=Campylobacter avium TaxID=522485 RepID=UPI001DCA64DB|nr:hypothetical protein [Campylobacter avium]HJE65946.1 hypothetical protein [Campylobacter avium]